VLRTALALTALLAQEPAQAPAPSPAESDPAAVAAAEALAELLRPCKEAEGVEAVIRMIGELPRDPEGGEPQPPLLVADVRIELRFARPSHGRLKMKGRMLQPAADGAAAAPDQDPVYRQVDSLLLGDGEGLFLIAEPGASAERVATTVAELGDDWPGLLPLQVWAGIPPDSEFNVLSLADPPRPGWRGFAIEQPWLRMEYWFDGDGGFRSASLDANAELQELLANQGQPRIPRYRMKVEKWLLHERASPEQFQVSLPEAESSGTDGAP